MMRLWEYWGKSLTFFLCPSSLCHAIFTYFSLSSGFINLHMVPSLQITEGNTCKTVQILWGCECWCNKIFTETREKSPMDGRHESMMPALATRIILSFWTRHDSLPNTRIYSFQGFHVFWNGASSLTVLESSPLPNCHIPLHPPVVSQPKALVASKVIIVLSLSSYFWTVCSDDWRGSIGNYGRGGSVAPQRRGSIHGTSFRGVNRPIDSVYCRNKVASSLLVT
jgi:hypothetical protein